MKYSNEQFEEWWEVVEEYFAKELEKNLVQHRVDERILKYISWNFIKGNFQFFFMVVQQIWRHQAKMRRLKWDPPG